MSKRIVRAVELSDTALAILSPGGWQLWLLKSTARKQYCARCSKALRAGSPAFRRVTRAKVAGAMCVACGHLVADAG